MSSNKKKSVLVYHNWLPFFEELAAEDSKKLTISIIKYSATGIEPSGNSDAFNAVWGFVKEKIQEDSESYSETCRIHAECGKKGGRPKKENSGINQKKPNGYYKNQTKAKKADIDIDIDKDKDSNDFSAYAPKSNIDSMKSIDL